MNLFSARLKWLRERMNISQKEMAQKIGVSQQYYNKFEKGTGQPNLETLYKIRHTTGESLDFIIGYTFEDKEATLLYEIYIDHRDQREKLENDIEHLSNDTFAMGKMNLEERMSLVSKLREGVLDYLKREERALDMFITHISELPGFDDHMNKEHWKNEYESYKNNHNVFFTDFAKKYTDIFD
ncbi:hypothetical protein H70357_24850 [Paenibacillus sp. FSL H7-0357]|uniref:helix-turn-helix transcriptional regulator n=1 Tax=Paenibacillus sp. FSL H7-0357 TaxID=1536774 RepID=UPI0004F5AA17|nr:helix-turn-helix transcriptional regulator [Paenibacillus sp. FSL H7-0357]AIQ19576.1 hypothetical protein H70357_24850 [Paenibacillus sp. FSL H7-0357]